MDRALRGAARDPRATSTTSPTGSTCAATSSSRRGDGAAYDEEADAGGHDRPGRVRRRVLHLRRRESLVAEAPRLPGARDFQGEWYQTAEWPHERRRLHGKRVGVVGTGSTGIQVIPQIAAGRAHLTVFQRTPNYSMPAHNGPLDPDVQASSSARYRERRRLARAVEAGGRCPAPSIARCEVSGEERRRIFEAGWARRRHRLALVRLQRRPQRPGGERDGRRVHAREDPRDRARPCRGGAPLPVAPHRHEADVRRHRLLRDLQPRQRRPGRRPTPPITGDHAARAPDGRRRVRARRDRLRDRLRRDDGRRSSTSTSAAARRWRCARSGRPARAPTSASPSPASRTSSSSPAPAARPCSATWSSRSSSTSTGSPTASRTCASAGSTRIEATPRGGGRLGGPRERVADAHALPARQLVVRGRERARQAAGLHALRRRLGRYRASATRWRRTGTAASG